MSARTRKARLIRLAWAAFLLVWALVPVSVHAQDQQVTIGVGDTVLVVNGRTSPGAFVTILDSNVVIGTTNADNTGAFSDTFTAFSAGIHTLDIYSRDNQDNLTDTVSSTINIAEHSTTQAAFFLPPTLNVENPLLTPGAQLQMFGSTIPGGRVSLIADAGGPYQTQANSGGLWQFALSSAQLTQGSHTIYAIVSDPLTGDQSYPTQPVNFIIQSVGVPAAPPLVPALQSAALAPPVIVYPVSGASFSDAQITLRCRAQPFSRVDFYNGAHSIGSTFADAKGNCTLSLTLDTYEYTLKARSCTPLLCSSFSPVTHIFYQAVQGAGVLSASLEQYGYIQYLGAVTTVRLHIYNGHPPFRVTINWDGGRSQVLTTTQSDISFSNMYVKTGQFKGKTTVRDADGRNVVLGFAVTVLAHSTYAGPSAFVVILGLGVVGAIVVLGFRGVRSRVRLNKKD